MRAPLAVGAAFLAGMGIELMKARGSWLFNERSDLGNISLTWLLFSLLGGMTACTLTRGVARGFVTVMGALAGFCLAEAWVLCDAWADGLVGGLVQCLSAGRMWFVLGMLSGPILGGLGGWLSQQGKTAWGWAVSGVLFVLEPCVMTAISRVPLPVLNIQWWYEWNDISFVELMVGAVCLIVWGNKMRQRNVD